MVKVFRFPPWAALFVVVGILALIVLSLPVFLIVMGGFVLTSLVRNIFFLRSSHNSQSSRSLRGYSDVIENKKIGAYRIKADESDPSVIEVVDP